MILMGAGRLIKPPIKAHSISNEASKNVEKKEKNVFPRERFRGSGQVANLSAKPKFLPEGFQKNEGLWRKAPAPRVRQPRLQ